MSHVVNEITPSCSQDHTVSSRLQIIKHASIPALQIHHEQLDHWLQ